ncbi:hypothetical protein Acr_01g0006520 [Actinidia rufa]|uniref:RNase H type-1 domain-containing protein n=1 Tax=Actinidia rufa TaxID=165716 RepID=A0A7J0E2T8_9ERIC|nr:hypothetical protein Acr_01g0006520 [Actinidia rufa]
MRNHCLPKPSASSPLDNIARPMANTSQAPSLEGLHHEIHSMLLFLKIIYLTDLVDLAMKCPRAAIVPVESRNNSPPLYVLGEKGVPQNPAHLAKLQRQRARKETELLKDYVKRFNQAILKVEDPSDNVVIMAMMEGFCPSPLFNSLSKNIPETLSALLSKADKYIAVEELAEAKCRQRGKDDHKRKESNTRRSDYRERCSSSSKKGHAKNAHGLAEEEIYNLFSSFVDAHPPITFNNYNLRGLQLPHDDALVISAVIANFNVQRILVDNGISTSILFISAFDKMKIGLDKLHPFHTPLVGFEGNMTHPTRVDQVTSDLGDKATPNHHLARLHHGVGEVRGDQKIADAEMEPLRDEVEQSALVDPRETKNTKLLKEVTPISIHPNYSKRHVMIGTEHDSELRSALTHPPNPIKQTNGIRHTNWIESHNNEAEYKALLTRLRVVVEWGVDALNTFSDSQLVVNQIPKEENKKSDALANLASSFDFISNRNILLEFLTNLSIEVAKLVCQADTDPTWMEDIIAYLQNGMLPPDKLQAHQIQYRFAKFCILN